MSRSDKGENGTLSLQIWDDVNNTRLLSLTKYDPKTDTLPIEITKKTGVYRAIVRDTTGLSGEMTFVVRAGALTQTRINTASSVLVAGASTIATIRLLDRLGQPISPDLHKMEINVTGGYIIDIDGNQKNSMTLDIMEPQIPITIGSSTAGTLQIQTIIHDTIR